MKKLFIGMVLAVVAVQVAGAYVWRPLGVPEMARWGATHVLEVSYADFAGTTATNTAKAITIALPAKTAAEFRAIILDAAFDTGNTNFTGSVALKVGDGSTTDLYLTTTELASDGTEVFVKFAPVVSAAAPALTPTTAQLIFVQELAEATAEELTVVTAVADATAADVVYVSSLEAATDTEITWDSDGSGTMATNTFVTAVGGALTTTQAVVTAQGAATSTTKSFVTAAGAATLATNTVVTGMSAAAPVITELGRKASTAAHNLVFTFTPNEEEALSANTVGKARLFFRITDWR
jgi:hypothetical protein